MKAAQHPFPKTTPIRYRFGKRKYVCSNCAAEFEWGEGSAWFGSLQDAEDAAPLIYACGSVCCAAIAKYLKYPPELPDLVEGEDA